ncbi:DUF7472 family protein [Natrarchaeobius chitinivorans]|uniref:Uncharacterized protein n=1 Tax=Natrarchaeobius chitinivorans TaxID=1679083 RepID=A0A3N6MIV6_NATCH|nr:hypothetical protein [Natrarchaeobius chitinivorans]RQG94006.1 hypothetical protein EA473_13080 [Natrarchaeobius chitinivorans]
MLEREQLIEIVVAVSSIVLMLGAMIYIGQTYGSDGVLQPEGAELLVAVIVGFIFLLTAVGIGLAVTLNDPEDGLEDDDADAQNAA